jgi:hypothetical protein
MKVRVCKKKGSASLYKCQVRRWFIWLTLVRGEDEYLFGNDLLFETEEEAWDCLRKFVKNNTGFWADLFNWLFHRDWDCVGTSKSFSILDEGRTDGR